MVFKSKSEEVRHYTKELLSDKETHSTEEIKRYVKDKMEEQDISPGVFSGAIRDLLAKEPQYVNVSRGKYCLVDDRSILMLHVEKSLNIAESDILHELDKIKVSSLNDDDFTEVRKVQSILKELHKLKEMLEWHREWISYG